MQFTLDTFGQEKENALVDEGDIGLISSLLQARRAYNENNIWGKRTAFNALGYNSAESKPIWMKSGTM